MVWQKNSDQPRYGWVLRQDEETIVFREYASDESIPIELKRNEILTVVVNIDQERLASLYPPDWSAYRDYAEELAVQKRDPTARELAVRLYLIAAHGSRELRRGCLSGLVALAEDESQRTQWKTLQQLYYPTVIRNADPQQNQPHSGPPIENAVALEIVRLVRRGASDEAMHRLAMDSTVAALNRWSDLISIDQLRQTVTQEQLTGEQLLRLLRMELALADPTSAIASDINPATSLQAANWAELARRSAATIPEIPSFNNITAFDPEASIFRDNRWVKP
jgi:hypothetical protein